jgi:DNA-directed RNA polymerase alpha subunit
MNSCGLFSQIRKKFVEDCIRESRKPTEEEIEALADECAIVYGESAVNPYIDSLPMRISVRAYYCLENMPIERIGDLRSFTEREVLGRKGVGKITFNELREILSTFGYCFKKVPAPGTDVPSPPVPPR